MRFLRNDIISSDSYIGLESKYGDKKKQLIGLEKEILSSEYLWFTSIVNQFEWPIFYVGLNRWIIEFMTNQAFNIKHSIVRILEFKKNGFLVLMHSFNTNNSIALTRAICFFAESPIRHSLSVNATYEGVVRLP
jgi:hypothetical protein